MQELLSPAMAWALAVTAAAGLVRGITGFGGAMVMAAPLALIFGPALAVPVVVLLETFAAAPMMREAVRHSNVRAIVPISIAAFVTVPIGGWFLASSDPLVVRRAIAATVIVFSLMLLYGARWHGRPRLRTSVALGALSGAMVGATSIGAPPVILYLLSGPDPIQVTRANLTLYIVAISAAALLVLVARGVLDTRAAVAALVLAPGFYGGVVLGSRLFSRFSDQRFRQFTLVFMMAVAVGILLA